MTTPTLLDRASLWLGAKTQSAGGATVRYRRGAESIDSLSVVWGQTSEDDYGGEESHVTARRRDAVCLVEDLSVLDVGRFLPGRGDEIDWIDRDGAKHTFAVLPAADDRCYRFTDQTHQRVRIHLVEVRPNVESEL